MIYPEEFQQLMDSFKIDAFSKNLQDFKKNIKRCSVCGHITNKDVCSICSSENRDKSLICVVEDSKSVFMFEKTGKYNGVYHVLGGLISPIDEINPEDINLHSLINNRINNDLSEVIIALNPSLEGETTSLYIQKVLEKKNIKLSRLSYGIPMGADIEYLDPLTIIRAIDDRKFLS